MVYTSEVKRAQVLIEDRQYRALISLSRRTGKGLSRLVRDAIDRMIRPASERAPRHRLRDIRGIGRDPGGPSAGEHDRILYGDRP